MFNGIFPPLPTPFTEDGALDLAALRSNVEKLNATGLAGYVALGSNSEAVHVTPEEATQVFATVKKAATAGKVVIGGAGQLSTLATIEMTKRAADAGCAAALIVTPACATCREVPAGVTSRSLRLGSSMSESGWPSLFVRFRSSIALRSYSIW